MFEYAKMQMRNEDYTGGEAFSKYQSVFRKKMKEQMSNGELLSNLRRISMVYVDRISIFG